MCWKIKIWFLSCNLDYFVIDGHLLLLVLDLFCFFGLFLHLFIRGIHSFVFGVSSCILGATVGRQLLFVLVFGEEVGVEELLFGFRSDLMLRKIHIVFSLHSYYYNY